MVCLVLTIVLDEVWARVVERVVLATDSPPPRWMGEVSLWMPSGIGLRIANAFGFRFEVGHGDEMVPFVLMTGAVGSMVWAAVLFGLVVLIRSSFRSRAGRAAA